MFPVLCLLDWYHVFSFHFFAFTAEQEEEPRPQAPLTAAQPTQVVTHFPVPLNAADEMLLFVLS